MPSNKEQNEKLAFDNGIALMKEVDDDIKTIGARSSWLLGFLIVTVLTLGGFLLAEQEPNDKQELINVIVGILFFICSMSIVIFIRKLIGVGNRISAYTEPKEILTENTKMSDKIAKLQSKLDDKMQKFTELNKSFDSLIIVFIFSLFSSSIFLSYLTFFA